jgi:hypothetical protein
LLPAPAKVGNPDPQQSFYVCGRAVGYGSVAPVRAHGKRVRSTAISESARC